MVHDINLPALRWDAFTSLHGYSSFLFASRREEQMERFQCLTNLKGPDQASEGSRLCPGMTSENIFLRGLQELDDF